MLNSRQRAQLRAMANSFDPVLHIGKGGISDTVLKQASGALYARELIKVAVLESAPQSVREIADNIAVSFGADVVQVIGSKFILYKKSKDRNIKNPIVLVK